MRLTALSILATLMLATGTVALSGCGIKPSDVDPPPGVKKDTFPRTYPDPATDPQPAQQ